MADTAHHTPFVLVIDEFPYLAASWPPISSLLQKFCDSHWAGTGLHLILCGSSMSFMERQVLSAKSPLYGRRTGQIRLRPFDFLDTEDFLSPIPRLDAAVLYAATGGVAEYLDFIDTSTSVSENLAKLFFDPSGRRKPTKTRTARAKTL
ncbi:ATP-binding protein [Varibaculum cambriense]|uniref:AAA family ATPase n=1 Tax=Varibaculum cambriense TaxID=184870 RepID=UPI0028FE043C|nr:ATP-binding protein [Varibaculum cambriense]MDU1223838.1 ATP-binding protein [Varibaculum cambriense]